MGEFPDSEPLRYVFCCCGIRSQDKLTFIQIGSGHTVDIPSLDMPIAYANAIDLTGSYQNVKK